MTWAAAAEAARSTSSSPDIEFVWRRLKESEERATEVESTSTRLAETSLSPDFGGEGEGGGGGEAEADESLLC